MELIEEVTIENSVISESKNNLFTRALIYFVVAIALLTFSIFSIIEPQFSTKEYILAYVFAAVFSFMVLAILNLIVTCLTSIVIIIVDNEFCMRRLYMSLYNYLSKNVLLSAVILFVIVNFDLSFNKIVILPIVFFTGAIFIIHYYRNMINYSSVNNLAAKIVVGFNIAFSLSGITLFSLN